jgi:hypothetical protein
MEVKRDVSKERGGRVKKESKMAKGSFPSKP